MFVCFCPIFDWFESFFQWILHYQGRYTYAWKFYSTKFLTFNGTQIEIATPFSRSLSLSLSLSLSNISLLFLSYVSDCLWVSVCLIPLNLCLCLCLSLCLSFCLCLFFCSSLCMSVSLGLSLHLYVCLSGSVGSSVSLFVYQSLLASLPIFVCPSVRPSVSLLCFLSLCNYVCITFFNCLSLSLHLTVI